MARRVPPFEVDIEALGPRGQGIGRAPDGRRVLVRGAPPGARVLVTVSGRKDGGYSARRTALIRPPPDAATPPCAVFGLCGGCALQELGLAAQRTAKADFAIAEFVAQGGLLDGVVVHPVRGAGAAYGYRNKVELSFGVRRYVSEADKLSGAPIDGRFLGFHAPGRFDRVVDAVRCELVSDAVNRALAVVRAHALHPDAPPPCDPVLHVGLWRHLLIREGDDGVLIVIDTRSPSSPSEESHVQALAQALIPHCVGVLWRINDGRADVARGEVRQTWGRDFVHTSLGAVRFRLSPTAFFQTNTAGARVLYDTVADALPTGGHLIDLYCGIGAIGLYLAHRSERLTGIEENAEAIVDAVENARVNQIEATFRAARVEDALGAWDVDDATHVVVDPPRAGLHPRVAAHLASLGAASLVYVACNPASLGRDAAVLGAGRWRLTDLWPVDLFPQTGHVEVVARFTPR